MQLREKSLSSNTECFDYSCWCSLRCELYKRKISELWSWQWRSGRWFTKWSPVKYVIQKLFRGAANMNFANSEGHDFRSGQGFSVVFCRHEGFRLAESMAVEWYQNRDLSMGPCPYSDTTRLVSEVNAKRHEVTECAMQTSYVNAYLVWVSYYFLLLWKD